MKHDADFHESIAPDVMKTLEHGAFFQKLDDLLSPTNESASAETCRRSFQIAEPILLRLGFSEEDLEDILGVLRSRGACCDCEVLYNVAESSRLKSKYWGAQAVPTGQKARHSPSGPFVDTSKDD